MRILQHLKWLATALAVVLHVYIYTYPSTHAPQCHWAREYRPKQAPFIQTVLDMPYIGDLLTTYLVAETEPRPVVADIRLMAVGDPQINGNWPSTPYLKRLDNYGNDYYLHHIYKLMKGRLGPSHVALMGDLVSSQWIGDSEFFNRTRRMAQRIYTRPRDQAQLEFDFIDTHTDTDWMGFYHQFLQDMDHGVYDDPATYHYEDVTNWYDSESQEPLFLNVTGNHDVGYGDATYQHMSRWRKLFGRDNFWIEYDNGTDHPWRIVMLNSLALDGPMLQPEFKDSTWKFVEVLEQRAYNGSTILLTHIPMHKDKGLCYDGPNVELYAASGCHGCDPTRVGLLKSTNFISPYASQRVLNAVFANGKPGIILTGHDHYGCENYINYKDGEWTASKTNGTRYVKEVTVRSMMGDFDGATGIMTGMFNQNSKEWVFEYSECRFVVQHVWWAAQVTLALAILFHSMALVL